MNFLSRYVLNYLHITTPLLPLPLRIDVIIRSHALRTLGAGAAMNREIMRPVKTLVLVSNRLNCSQI